MNTDAISIYRGGIIAKTYYNRAKNVVKKDVVLGVEKNWGGGRWYGLSEQPLLNAGQQTVSWAGFGLFRHCFCNDFIAKEGLHSF